MKILFFCIARNSHSQRLHLTLSRSHEVTVKYALSDETVLEAVNFAKPDIIICSFLTPLIHKCIYDDILTLIIHPGPPGDAGPSALDWVLMGDDGTIEDAEELLTKLDNEPCSPGRSWWGITVIQAIEKLDAGPVWAFQQFPIDIDEPGLTKSQLYRSSVSSAAILACEAAVKRVERVAAHTIQQPVEEVNIDPSRPQKYYSARLPADSLYGEFSVSDGQPFRGGALHQRPLLRAASRNFDPLRHTARQISRRIRCGDSTPGALSEVFGPRLYVYGGIVDNTLEDIEPLVVHGIKTRVLAIRYGAICIPTSDSKGIWITHVRRPGSQDDCILWPKVPAVTGLGEMRLLNAEIVTKLHIGSRTDWSRSVEETFQEVWVDIEIDKNRNRSAYLHFDFYNGAMGTAQCSQLIDAMEYIIAQSTSEEPIRAIVLMGGAYFSNGIALNVIEAAVDPAQESWLNINRINDVVYYILHEFPIRNIMTIAAFRGNAAGGGVALGTACDLVIAASDVVLNPAYGAVRLYGSEYHTISYNGRCGIAKAKEFLCTMTPIGPIQGCEIGLIDIVFPGVGGAIDHYIYTHVALMLKNGTIRPGLWKKNIDISITSLATARANELREMNKDFLSSRSIPYHSRRSQFLRKIKSLRTPICFAEHRRLEETPHDREKTTDFHYAERATLDLLNTLGLSDVTPTVEDQRKVSQKEFSTGKRVGSLSISLPRTNSMPTRLTPILEENPL